MLGVLPGIVGAIQANETIKIILGAEGLMINRLLLFDAWTMKFREFKLRKDPKCPVCGENPTVKELIDYEEFCGIAAHQQTPAPESKLEEISAMELNARRLRGDAIQVVDVREPQIDLIAEGRAGENRRVARARDPTIGSGRARRAIRAAGRLSYPMLKSSRSAEAEAPPPAKRSSRQRSKISWRSPPVSHSA